MKFASILVAVTLLTSPPLVRGEPRISTSNDLIELYDKIEAPHWIALSGSVWLKKFAVNGERSLVVVRSIKEPHEMVAFSMFIICKHDQRLEKVFWIAANDDGLRSNCDGKGARISIPPLFQEMLGDLPRPVTNIIGKPSPPNLLRT